jgi:hypothetical protein
MIAGHLLDWHGFTGDARLVDERMAVKHGSVDRDTLAGRDEDRVANRQLLGSDGTDQPRPPHGHLVRQELQKIANGLAPAVDRHALQYFSDQHEQGDDERGEELPDGGRCQDRDRHRQLHCHASLDDVVEGLFEDRPAPDRETERADHAERRIRLPDAKPHGGGCNNDNADANGC